MNSPREPSQANVAVLPLQQAAGRRDSLLASHRVLRNTYALLGMTLLWAAAVAGGTAALGLPHPGMLLTLGGYFGLLFLTYKLANSGWGLLSVFGLTGFMGYTLGPVISHYLGMSGGTQIVTLALGTTAVTFFALSAWALTSKRDFSFMSGFLFAGMVVALLMGLAAMFFELPALSLAVSGLVVLLASGLILMETSRIVNSGETNYILATVGLFVSIFNLFSALLSLFGFGSSNE
ncbi:UNVERIFIED_ORG: Bax inhibitor-1/YccA family protein [Shinella sp. XGS7]|nr:Bax inhibitor-1/YccA family protein [Shinella sp. XGS7]